MPLEHRCPLGGRSTRKRGTPGLDRLL